MPSDAVVLREAATTHKKTFPGKRGPSSACGRHGRRLCEIYSVRSSKNPDVYKTLSGDFDFNKDALSGRTEWIFDYAKCTTDALSFFRLESNPSASGGEVSTSHLHIRDEISSASGTYRPTGGHIVAFRKRIIDNVRRRIFRFARRRRKRITIVLA